MRAEQNVEARPTRYLTPLALALLKEGNSYEYELMEHIEEEFGFEQINPGSEYRALRHMERKGSAAQNGPSVARREALRHVGCAPSPTSRLNLRRTIYPPARREGG